jgi:hypothetical protein
MGIPPTGRNHVTLEEMRGGALPIAKHSGGRYLPATKTIRLQPYVYAEPVRLHVRCDGKHQPTRNPLKVTTTRNSNSAY